MSKSGGHHDISFGRNCMQVILVGYWLHCFTDCCVVACRARFDLVFALDAAWCLSINDFRMQLDFVRNVTIGLGDADFQIGILVYSNVANITLNLGDFSNNRKLNTLKAISTLYRFVSIPC